MKLKTIVAILAVILAILLVILACLLVQKHMTASQPDETDTPTQTTTESSIDEGTQTTAADEVNTTAGTAPVLPTADPDQYAEDETFGEDDVADTVPGFGSDSEEPAETTEDSNMLQDEDF